MIPQQLNPCHSRRTGPEEVLAAVPAWVFPKSARHVRLVKGKSVISWCLNVPMNLKKRYASARRVANQPLPHSWQPSGSGDGLGTGLGSLSAGCARKMDNRLDGSLMMVLSNSSAAAGRAIVRFRLGTRLRNRIRIGQRLAIENGFENRFGNVHFSSKKFLWLRSVLNPCHRGRNGRVPVVLLAPA